MNNIIRNLWGLALAAGLVACSGNTVQGDYQVVPLPQEVTVTEGSAFVLNAGVKIYYPAGNSEMAANAGFLAQYVKALTGFELAATEGTGKGIVLALDSSINNPEGYRMQVDGSQITITGATPAGVFYGIQTLRKSIPANA